jgi:hypothetical protein
LLPHSKSGGELSPPDSTLPAAANASILSCHQQAYQFFPDKAPQPMYIIRLKLIGIETAFS